jgi:DNA-binding SARP family transcriptional activator
MEAARPGGGDGYGQGLLVRVLGTTRVERDGEVAAIGGPRQRAVLTRLVLAERRLVTVDRLIEDVWGDEAPRTVVATLHSHLSLLRRALGDPDLLRREGPGYVLDIPVDEVDATWFERLVDDTRANLAADPAEALRNAEWALSLWRGPAYADVADTEWGRAAAVRLGELRLGVMEARFDALLALGRHGDALAPLERAIDEYPLHERFAAQLVLALYRAGRQVEALRAFDDHRNRLVEELGLDPGPDLLKLQSAILGHEAWLAAPEVVALPARILEAHAPTSAVPAATGPAGAPGEGEPGAPSSPPASPVRLPGVAIRHHDRPFVGRDAELATLREAWSSATSGSRRLVVVTGEAGAGKTRLVSRFVQEAHQQGAIVMWGRATIEAIVPFEPVVEGLRNILRTVSPEAQKRVVEGRDALSLLIPDLADLVPGVEVVRPEIGTERFVLFETVADLLESESAVWPLIFVLDDLQFCDQLSLRMLDHLLRHERTGRVLLLGTVRTVPHHPNQELDTFLSALHRDGLVDRVSLEGLGPDDVAALLESGGWSAGGATPRAVHRATGGNPFFVTELAQQGAAPDGTELPDSVREVLGARLDRLDEQTSRLVSLAAVGGPVVPISVLARAGHFSGEEVLDGIDTAIAEGVLTEEGPTGSVTFPHGLVQQAVLDRLSRSRRSALHLSIADGLAESGDSSKAELAHHLVNAGPLAPRDVVVQACVDAGHHALSILAYEEADRWAQRAIEAGGNQAPDALRCTALLLRSDSQRALGNRVDAKAAASEAADVARGSGDPLLLARAAEGLALARAAVGFDYGTEDAELDALLEEALRALPADATSHRARLIGASVSKVAARGDVTAVDRLSHLVMRLPDSEQHPVLVATAHLVRRMASWRLDLLDERVESDRAALAAAEQARNHALALNALLYGITDLTEAGQIMEADEWFRRFRSRAAEVRQPVYDAFVLFIEGTIALLRGEYETSARFSDEALEIGRKSHGNNAEQAWAGHAFVRAWDQGRLAGLVDVVANMEGPQNQPIWQIGHAAALVAAGRPDEARPALEEFVTDTVELDDNSLWLTAAAMLAEVARALDDKERAAVLHRCMEPYKDRIVLSGLGRVCLGPVARFAGISAHTAGDLEAAEPLLWTAHRNSRMMLSKPFLARTQWDRSLLLADLGREDDAKAARQEAEELASSIGMALGGLARAPAG